MAARLTAAADNPAQSQQHNPPGTRAGNLLTAEPNDCGHLAQRSSRLTARVPRKERAIQRRNNGWEELLPFPEDISNILTADDENPSEEITCVQTRGCFRLAPPAADSRSAPRRSFTQGSTSNI
ncbi:unnamed protein product [Arctogadus glacialis]